MIGFGSFFFLQKRSLVESIRIWCMVDVEVWLVCWNRVYMCVVFERFVG